MISYFFFSSSTLILIGIFASILTIVSDINQFHSKAIEDLKEFQHFADESYSIFIETNGPTPRRRSRSIVSYGTGAYATRDPIKITTEGYVTVQSYEEPPPECPHGLPGTKGTNGYDGEPGLPGSDGLPGLDGIAIHEATYKTCIICPHGPPGISGPDGPRGIIGTPGPIGAPGLQSSSYPVAGKPGPPGDKGRPGSDGPPGVVGKRGQQGTHCIPGPRGPPGQPGEMGSVGRPGEHPPRASRGPPGSMGAPGMIGRHGRAGMPGSPGRMGERGKPGKDGLYCLCPVRPPTTPDAQYTIPPQNVPEYAYTTTPRVITSEPPIYVTFPPGTRTTRSPKDPDFPTPPPLSLISIEGVGLDDTNDLEDISIDRITRNPRNPFGWGNIRWSATTRSYDVWEQDMEVDGTDNSLVIKRHLTPTLTRPAPPPLSAYDMETGEEHGTEDTSRKRWLIFDPSQLNKRRRGVGSARGSLTYNSDKKKEEYAFNPISIDFRGVDDHIEHVVDVQ